LRTSFPNKTPAISKLELVLDIYPSLSLILRYIYCLVFQGASSLSDNTLEKDENSPDNGFEVGEYNTYEAYNSENQYFTREDYTYNYDLLNAI
ncbi:hypothetical protein COD49_27790, partial [Escherichia coli]